MKTETVDTLILGAGSAGSNAFKGAFNTRDNIVVVHPPELINTCIEEGCMPSKSLLAGAHKGEDVATIETTRNIHIDRLKKALLEGFDTINLNLTEGTASFVDDQTVMVEHPSGSSTIYTARSIIIATGSTPFVPPISGLEIDHERILISDDIVSKNATLSTSPKRVLTIGGGPIGLELSTVFHDLGAHVDVLQRGTALTAFDPEFGAERVRASMDKNSFPIHLDANLTKVEKTEHDLICTIDFNGTVKTEIYDIILVATGRKPNTEALMLENTSIKLSERGAIEHDEYMKTSVDHIYVAGDVTGHHQILHFASEMGFIAGHNASVCSPETGEHCRAMDYDKNMLAVSFDQFPSALIGITETEAKKRGIEVITATKQFNSIGLGILKRQEYGLWKLVAEKSSGCIIGSQIIGPDSSGELIQILSPVIYNSNTYQDIISMTWYHPTYGEILKSLARDLGNQYEPLLKQE